jgi:hypothetical protein
MQQDPAGYADGTDLYRYERAAPIQFLDPFGEAAVPTTQPQPPRWRGNEAEYEKLRTLCATSGGLIGAVVGGITGAAGGEPITVEGGILLGGLIGATAGGLGAEAAYDGYYGARYAIDWLNYHCPDVRPGPVPPGDSFPNDWPPIWSLPSITN